MTEQQRIGAIVFCSLIVIACSTAQEFIPLWTVNSMPNSKGLLIQDSIANERVQRVGTPGVYAFFPSLQENKGTAVLICPGGGYSRLAYLTSGHQLAKWFNTMGVAAFVLNYRLPTSPDLNQREIGPLQDAQRAMRLIRARATRWSIDPGKIGVLGTSAGGHLAAILGTQKEDISATGDSLNRFRFHPDFMILLSPVITMGHYAHQGSRKNLLGENPTDELIRKYSAELQVTTDTPPAFLVHAYNDQSVHQQNSLLFYHALQEKTIPASLHIFPQGGHSIALRNNPGSTELWTTLCEQWLIEMGFLTKSP